MAMGQNKNLLEIVPSQMMILYNYNALEARDTTFIYLFNLVYRPSAMMAM
jgi:hypothetical protein